MITTVSPGNIVNHSDQKKIYPQPRSQVPHEAGGPSESAAATSCSVKTFNDTLPHPPPHPRLRGEPSKSFLSIC